MNVLRQLQQNGIVVWMLRLAFAVILLILLFTQIELRAVLYTFQSINVVILLFIFCSYFVIRYLMAYQMSLGLAPLGFAYRTFDIFTFILIAGFYTLILPGELAAGAVTWYKLSRNQDKRIEAGALLVYFRLINTLTLVGIGLFAMFFDARLSIVWLRTLVGMACLCFTLLLVPFFSTSVLKMIKQSVQFLLRRVNAPKWMRSRLHTVWDATLAFQELSDGRTVVLVFGLSLVIHALQIFNFYLFASSIGIQLSPFVIGWVRSVITVVQMIPISVAGLGVREISMVVLLNNYGVPETQAVGLSLVMFGMIVVTGLVGGVFEAWDLMVDPTRANREISNTEPELTK